ncbi:MAG: hypothetical protein KTR28_05420 [Micavibrio sp.]|nr:hypothetical protein [Micavibrio sp.]
MTSQLLSLIMDVAVLLALAGTIYYALRLSRALENFKGQREQMQRTILELSSQVDSAQNAIKSLKKASDNAANDLDDVLHDSRRMAEELKIINESGNSLANRLEKLAAKTSNQAPAFREKILDDNEPEIKRPKKEVKKEKDAPSFFIQDTDFLERDGGLDEDGSDIDNGAFASRAEKELFDALQKNKQEKGTGK